MTIGTLERVATPPAVSPAGAHLTGTAPVAVDGITAAVLLDLPDAAVDGFVVKSSPGADAGYGQGQAFMVLEAGPTGSATDSSPAGAVMFRVDRKGNLGITGGAHFAAGIRYDDVALTQAVWIDPGDNMHGLIIHNPTVGEAAVWDKDFLRVVDTRNDDAVVFRVAPTGQVEATTSILAKAGGALQTTIGDLFGFAGVGFGAPIDTLLWRAAAGVIGVANVFELGEVVAPAAPAVNKVRLFSQDNGAGKTQVCARFNTGATVVLATQP